MTRNLIERFEAMAEDMQAIRIEFRQTRGASDYRTGWFAGAQAAYEDAAALLRSVEGERGGE